jgi:hypothetical protein
MLTGAQSLVIPDERRRAERGHYRVLRTFDGRLLVGSLILGSYRPMQGFWNPAKDLRLRLFLLNWILCKL